MTMPHAAQQLDLSQRPDDVDAILAAHGGDARAALRAVIDEAARARADMDRVLDHVSEGYVRGRRRAG
jgi:hypothetical protein